MSSNNFWTTSRRRRFEGATTSAADLWSRCQAAARMGMRGQNWSTEDRMDAAADALERALGASYTPPAWSGTAADVLAWVALAEGLAATGRVPNECAAFGRLTGYVANYRRGLERTRERDSQAAMDRAAELEFTAWTAADVSPVKGTPVQARRTAIELLAAIGQLDRVVHWGPVWTAAYAAARTASGTDMDADALALELDLKPATYRQHLKRAADRLSGYGARERSDGTWDLTAWADALSLPTGGRALKPSRSRTEAANMGDRADGWRDYLKPADHAPVEVRRMGGAKRVRMGRSAWAIALERGTPQERRTAARLAAAAAIRRERAGLETAADTAALK